METGNRSPISEPSGVWQFWIDVGGTFTDCIARSPAGELHHLQGALVGRGEGTGRRDPVAQPRRLVTRGSPAIRARSSAAIGCASSTLRARCASRPRSRTPRPTARSRSRPGDDGDPPAPEIGARLRARRRRAGADPGRASHPRSASRSTASRHRRPPGHHPRHQRAARAPRRGHRAGHHRGLSRRPRHRLSEPAAAVRARDQEAGAALREVLEIDERVAADGSVLRAPRPGGGAPRSGRSAAARRRVAGDLPAARLSRSARTKSWWRAKPSPPGSSRCRCRRGCRPRSRSWRAATRRWSTPI